jgi:hypothetical protein
MLRASSAVRGRGGTPARRARARARSASYLARRQSTTPYSLIDNPAPLYTSIASNTGTGTPYPLTEGRVIIGLIAPDLLDHRLLRPPSRGSRSRNRQSARRSDHPLITNHVGVDRPWIDPTTLRPERLNQPSTRGTIYSSISTDFPGNGFSTGFNDRYDFDNDPFDDNVFDENDTLLTPTILAHSSASASASTMGMSPVRPHLTPTSTFHSTPASSSVSSSMPTPTPISHIATARAVPTNIKDTSSDPATSGVSVPMTNRNFFMECTRCGMFKSSVDQFDRRWDSTAREWRMEDHCLECAGLMICPSCKDWHSPDLFIRMVGGREQDTKNCLECRNSDSARKRVADAKRRDAKMMLEAHEFELIEWEEFVELAISS